MHILAKRLCLVLLALPAMGQMPAKFGPARKPGDLTKTVGIGEFPAGDLLSALEADDVIRMRRHAWSLFSGLTSQDALDVKAPIFLSWYTKANVFETHAEDNGKFGLEVPKQVLDALKIDAKLLVDPILAAAPVLDKIYFNASAYAHIIDNKLNEAPARTKLNCDLKNSTPLEDRKIPDFPNDAVAVKTIWRVASATKLTALPVWDPESNAPHDRGNDPDLSNPGEWSRYVAVNTDPKVHYQGDHANIRPVTGKMQQARVVPLSRLFHIKIAAETLAAAVQLAPHDTPQPGDYLILVGMHVTTKEIPNWVWATFWWHDRPDAGPFAAQRPSSVRGAWRNYLMNVSYDMETPREKDGSPHVSFNPYLEAQKDGGIKSNCMTCHRLAAWPPLPQETTRGTIPDWDPRFAGKIKVDFLWTLSDAGDATACLAK